MIKSTTSPAAFWVLRQSPLRPLSWRWSARRKRNPPRRHRQVSPAIKPGTNTSFGPLKQVDAGVLDVGYAEAGPADGPAVILLHGWPYDIHSYADVAPLLASKGYRVIVPYLRGYGTTRFLSGDYGPVTASNR